METLLHTDEHGSPRYHGPRGIVCRGAVTTMRISARRVCRSSRDGEWAGSDAGMPRAAEHAAGLME